ncbi:F-box family protein [Rhynchospora pubera]|uniref:F-box family protein n=1 Tax=Rhynchospora pubera TaxID=906938 RepID=A0AAV8FIL9_9POAL|nr:F-box family protein [Rhynchospora pubera]
MEGEASAPAFPDWAHLPFDIVHVISTKVKSITDFVRFRAVCSPWRSATLAKPRHLPPQLPWLMLPRRSRDKLDDDDGVRLFYDLWESKTRKLHLPETIGMVCCSSYRGWFLLVGTEGKEVFLLNPLTKARFQLPPIGTPARHLGGKWDHPRYDHSWHDPYLGTFAIGKVIFSSDLTDPNCLITVVPQNCRGFLCCRVGDPTWTRIYDRLNCFSDVTFYNGWFYLLYQGAMEVIELNKPEKRILHYLDTALDVSSMFLEGKSGVYVVADRFFEEEDEDEEDDDDDDDDDEEEEEEEEEGLRIKKTLKKNFELYQLQERPFKLNQVTDTRNTSIFCGNEVSPYLAVCSDDWDSLDGDSIYKECMGWSIGKDGGKPSYNRSMLRNASWRCLHIT